MSEASPVKSSTTKIQASSFLTVIVIITIAILSCITSLTILLHGLIHEGPAFYNGQECRMTYSQFQFLPLRVLPPSSSSTPLSSSDDDDDDDKVYNQDNEQYRLLKFTDARDPRHKHLYPISGTMMENYNSQSSSKRNKKESNGRLLDLEDNWCLLPHTMNKNKEGKYNKRRTSAPYPHRGHPLLYVPGHWGSFSQARSIGAHGTRWTGQYEEKGLTDREIYESLLSGVGMHDGDGITNDGSNDDTTPSTDDAGGIGGSANGFMEWISSSSFQHHLNGFVMDVFTLDFDEQGAALHPSILLRQAEFFARSVETIVEGCHLSSADNEVRDNGKIDGNDNGKQRNQGITIVAHSIGAWVVRIALELHPHLENQGYVRNVITLASPLGAVPYAVDGGVHDVVQYINSGGGGGDDDDHDVTMISISGGLRDELIPPEMCQVPPTDSPTNEDADTFFSNTFLASSIPKTRASSSNTATMSNLGGNFGMDHRAIVWCYDLLRVVREVIFTLIVATDHGLNSTERMRVAQEILYVEMEIGLKLDQKQTKDKKIKSDQAGVNEQHAHLVREKGYWRAVSIQLSAPYNLNLLLKLCIAAALLHTVAVLPMMQHIQQSQTRKPSLMGKCCSTATSLIAIPSLILILTWARASCEKCYGHECHLLLGTIFILSQLGTLIYFLIINGICVVVAAIWDMCSKRCNHDGRENVQPWLTSSFRGLCERRYEHQRRLLTLIVLPLTTLACATINTAIYGHDVIIVWNRISFASYFFLSFVLIILVNLIVLACKPSPVSSERRRSELFVLFLVIIKATLGKVLYAFSLTTQSGQDGMGSYHDLWSRMGRSRVVIGGCGNDLIMCFLITLLPVFAAVVVTQTYEIMSQNISWYWKVEESSSKEEISKKVISQYKESKITNIVHGSLVCWYCWNVSVNFSRDDIIVPLYSFIICFTTYLRCAPFSKEAMDVCLAMTRNDLDLQCDIDAENHDKND